MECNSPIWGRSYLLHGLLPNFPLSLINNLKKRICDRYRNNSCSLLLVKIFEKISNGGIRD